MLEVTHIAMYGLTPIMVWTALLRVQQLVYSSFSQLFLLSQFVQQNCGSGSDCPFGV